MNEEWIPKTELGKLVKSGEITDLEQVYERGYAILEPEIVDYLVPDLEDEVLEISMVQRMTDSGRRSSFFAVVVVGNKKGIVGIGTGKATEVRKAIEKAIKDAKMNIIKVRMGCGSWECACGEEHSLPFTVEGKCSSVKVRLMPAPKGTGIVAGETARKVLQLAGVKDVWSKTFGNTRTKVNFARAVLEALKMTRRMRL